MSGGKQKGNSKGNLRNTHKNKKTQSKSSNVDFNHGSYHLDNEVSDEDQTSETEMKIPNGTMSMSEEEKDIEEGLCDNLQNVTIQEEENYNRIRDDCFPLQRDRDAVYFEGTRQQNKSKERRKGRQQRVVKQVEPPQLGFLDIRKCGGSPPNKWHVKGGAELFTKAPRHIRQEQLMREQAQVAATANDFQSERAVTSVRRCEHQNSIIQSTVREQKTVKSTDADSSFLPSSTTKSDRNRIVKKNYAQEWLSSVEANNSYWTPHHLRGWIHSQEFKKKEEKKNENQANGESNISENPQQSYWGSPAETIVSPKGPFFPSLYPSDNRHEQQERSARNGSEERPNTMLANAQSTSVHSNSYTGAHSSVFTGAYSTAHSNGYSASGNDTFNEAYADGYTPIETDDYPFAMTNGYNSTDTGLQAASSAYNDAHSVEYPESQDYLYSDTDEERYGHPLTNGYANGYRDPHVHSYENMLPNGYGDTLSNGYQNEHDEYDDTLPSGYRNTLSHEFQNNLPNGYGSTSTVFGNTLSSGYSDVLTNGYANSHSNHYAGAVSNGYADSFPIGYEDRHIGSYTTEHNGYAGRNEIHASTHTGAQTHVCTGSPTSNTNNMIFSQASGLMPSHSNTFIPSRSLVTSQTDSVLPIQTDSLTPSQRAALMPSQSNMLIPGHSTFLPGRTRTLLPGHTNGLLPGHTGALAVTHMRELIPGNAALSASHSTTIAPHNSLYAPQPSAIAAAAAADTDPYFAAYSGGPTGNVYPPINARANSLNNFSGNNYFTDGISEPLHADNSTYNNFYSEYTSNMNPERYGDYRSAPSSHEPLDYRQNGIFPRSHDANYPLGYNVPYLYDNGRVWSTDIENSNLLAFANQPHVEDELMHSQSGLDLTDADRMLLRQHPSNIPSSDTRNYLAANYPISGNVLSPANSGLPQGATNNFETQESVTASSGINQTQHSFMMNVMRMPSVTDGDTDSAYTRYSQPSQYLGPSPNNHT